MFFTNFGLNDDSLDDRDDTKKDAFGMDDDLGNQLILLILIQTSQMIMIPHLLNKNQQQHKKLTIQIMSLSYNHKLNKIRL